MTAERHPAYFSAKEARRRIQFHADVQATNAWLAAEVAAMNESKWKARVYGAMTVATWTFSAAVWVAIVVIAWDVLS